ncbi:MAG: hypothetical protein ABFD49_11715 [Armatimonadota bacterium]|nr:hypothetical protein [bacterium]
MPRAVVGRPNFFDMVTLKECGHAVAINTVVITDDVFGLNAKRSRLAKLLDDPQHRRMLCDSEIDAISRRS